MDIKAIICDVNGTLLNSEGVVTPVTLQAIKDAKKKGILFGISTGRDINSVKIKLDEWGISCLVDIIIGSDGAEIYDYIFDYQEDNYPLDGELIKEIVDHYKDLDVNFAIPYDGVLYAPKFDYHIQKLATQDNVPFFVTDYDNFLVEPKSKIKIIFDPNKLEEVLKRSETFKTNKNKVNSILSKNGLFEYIDYHISKTFGLKKAMSKHNIKLKQICTFGDGDNDYDLILNTGIGVAMANGSDKTKSVADYQTQDNNHDGIGNFINKYFI